MKSVGEKSAWQSFELREFRVLPGTLMFKIKKYSHKWEL